LCLGLGKESRLKRSAEENICTRERERNSRFEKLHNKEFHFLYSSTHMLMIMTIKPRTIKCKSHADPMGEGRYEGDCS
jgi:hypothetical protein